MVGRRSLLWFGLSLVALIGGSFAGVTITQVTGQGAPPGRGAATAPPPPPPALRGVRLPPTDGVREIRPLDRPPPLPSGVQLSQCQVASPEPSEGIHQITASGKCDLASVAIMVERVTGFAIGTVEHIELDTWSVELIHPAKPHQGRSSATENVSPTLLRPGAGRPPR